MSEKNHIKTIGVLGGMGATVSAVFYKQLVALAQTKYQAEQDSDFPAIFIYNLPVRDFDETGFVDIDSVRNQLVDAVKKLETAGSEFIVIPCNTVHLLLEDMQKPIHIPIVSIIDAVVDAVLKKGFKTVGLASSQSTRDTQLYERAFIKKDIRVLSVTDDEQKQINEVIGQVIKGVHSSKELKIMQSISNRFQREGAQAVVLGCTELPLVLTTKDIELPIFDSNTLLAETALSHAYGR